MDSAFVFAFGFHFQQVLTSVQAQGLGSG